MIDLKIASIIEIRQKSDFDFNVLVHKEIHSGKGL